MIQKIKDWFGKRKREAKQKRMIEIAVYAEKYADVVVKGLSKEMRLSGKQATDIARVIFTAIINATDGMCSPYVARHTPYDEPEKGQ